MEKEYAIETINLCKKYGNLVAVDNLNLQVEKGTVYGLLGPNGAGKTTTILMLLGLTEPTSGQAIIAGYDSSRNPLQVKSLVGYMPDNVGFYEELTGEENLLYTAELNGLPRSLANKRIAQALERVGLKAAGGRKVSEYSRGMRQRLGIADVLVKDPQIIIMDEPTLGIDPKGIHELLALITSLAKEDGRTILISSHLLHQIQKICDQVGIFVQGKLIASGTLKQLESQLLPSDCLEIELKTSPSDENLLALCRAFPGIRELKWENDLLVLTCDRDLRQDFVPALTANGYCPIHLSLRGTSLDSIYLRYFRKEEA
ncbi:MAG TPA: ABC transporter ATP-binding protein [Peptococcaceae bacterium]|nr:ABC transporter ATP-binding protein [Peptococcaceae bacterium]